MIRARSGYFEVSPPEGDVEYVAQPATDAASTTMTVNFRAIDCM
jgi:hypothetical protein